MCIREGSRVFLSVPRWICGGEKENIKYVIFSIWPAAQSNTIRFLIVPSPFNSISTTLS